MRFDPRKLIEFKAIAVEGSFGKAAKALGVSQPALSLSIATLEQALGVKLFNRSRGGAVPTEFGTLLLARADALEHLLDSVRQDVRLRSIGLEGAIHIGVSPVGAAVVLADAIGQFRQTASAVAISISELPDDMLISELSAGRLDLTISPAGVNDEDDSFERQVIAQDRFVLISAHEKMTPRFKTMRLRDFNDATFVMPVKESAMSKYIASMFFAAGLSWPRKSIVCNSISLIKTIVTATDYVAIISERLVRNELQKGLLAACDLKEAPPHRDICLRYLHSNRKRPVVDRFISCVLNQKEPAD